MNPEEVKAAGAEQSTRPPGRNPGEVLHQRRKLPYSPTTMAIAGLVIVGTVAYFVAYSTKKPEASAKDVAKVTTGTAHPEETRPRK